MIISSPKNVDSKTTKLLDQKKKGSNMERRKTLAVAEMHQNITPSGMYLPEIYKFMDSNGD